jgi:hypothetical protein
MLVGPSFRWSVRWLVGPHNEILRKLFTWKTGYVAIASKRGEGRGNRFASRLVTVAHSLFYLWNQNWNSTRPVWQGVSTDSLRFHLGSPMPHPSIPCRRATPETPLWQFMEWPTGREGGLRPSSTPLHNPCRTGPNSFKLRYY